MGRPTTAKQQLTATVVGIASIGPKRGLSREEAADFVGVCSTMFNKMVADGRMPKPIRIGTRRIWDILDVDHFFNALKSANDDDEPNSWDEVM